jgi:hypothetical protein
MRPHPFPLGRVEHEGFGTPVGREDKQAEYAQQDHGNANALLSPSPQAMHLHVPQLLINGSLH